MGKLTVAAVSNRHAILSAFMKIFQTSHERRAATRGAGSRPIISAAHGVVAVLALLALPLSAQSAANFKIKTPKTPQAEAIAPTKDKPADMLQSRYVKPEDLPGHVQALASVLTIRKRETDPFGQNQDPDAKPIIKPTVAKIKSYAPAQATPFADIVRLIKVTTVMPRDKCFLIGTRTIKQGDHIPLSFRGKTIKVEIAAVTSSAIEFRNTENGEQASVPLNLLPVGMTPGNEGISAPGMVADRPDAPINLDTNPL